MKTLQKLATLAGMLAVILGAGALAVSAEEWRRGEFEYDKAPHRFGPHCEYRVAARGSASVNLFGGHHEKDKAERRSILDWEGEASRLFGPQYASWERAEGKELHCEVRGLDFICFAAANPCRERHEH